MKRKRLIIFSIIMVFTLLFTITMTGCSEMGDYARITDVDYRAVVVDEPGSEGKIVVTERITFDIHASSPSNGFWELWRDLCEDWIDGVQVHYKVNSVKQILPDGTEIIWPESPQLYWEDYDYISSELGPGKWFHSPGPYNEARRAYECIFFYIDDVYRDQMTFEIEYEMYNAVLRYGDCADLYIAMYSGDTTKYLKSFHGEILIPNKDMPQQGCYEVTTYGTEEGSFHVSESADAIPGYYTFFFDLTEKQLASCTTNDFIEIDIVSYGADKHAFADYASKNDWYDYPCLEEIWLEQAEYINEIENAKTIRAFFFAICVCIAICVVIAGFKSIADLKKRYPFYSSDLPTETYRDIPNDLDPKFAAALVFAKDKKPKDDGGIYSALLLSLARKKYVDIQEFARDDVLITLLEDPNRPAPPPIPNPIGEAPVFSSEQENYVNSLFPYEQPTQSISDTLSIPIDDFATRQEVERQIPKPETPVNPYTTRGALVANPYGSGPFDKPDPFATKRTSPIFGNEEYPRASAVDWGNITPPALEETSSLENEILDTDSSAFPEAHQAPEEPEIPAYEGPSRYDQYARFSAYAAPEEPETNEPPEKPAVQSVFPFLERAESIRPDVAIVYSEPEYVDSREALTPGEELYLNLIKRHAVDNCVTMEIFQRRISVDYSYIADFARNLDNVVINCGINMGYFQKANWQEPKQKLSSASDAKITVGILSLGASLVSLLAGWHQAVWIGLILVGLASILTGAYVRKQAHKYVLFTESGEQEYKKWRGLYNFLNSDTLIKDKTFVELPLWEKYLVYATAFDIADKVIAAIKIRCPETMVQTKSIVHNPYCRSSVRLRHSSRGFRSSVHRGRSGGSHGGFGGGGFGYGGGGRGGGGGGGGH